MKFSMKKCLTAAAAVLLCPAAVQGLTLHAENADYLYEDTPELTKNYTNSYSYYNDGERVTGKFSLAPAYALGDINENGVTNIEDVSLLLSGIARFSFSDSAEEVWSEVLGIDAPDVAHIESISDVNSDNAIDVADCSLILEYIANRFMDSEARPLGFTWYYADENGILQRGFIYDAETGLSYYANSKYRLATGWFSVNGETYYSDENAVIQKDCWITVSGNRYLLDEDGRKVTNTWVDTEDGKLYLGETGTPQKGWLTLEGTSYYFDMRTAVLTQNTWLTLEDSTYYFDETGAMQTGWLSLGDHTYYLGEDGVRRTGLTEADDKTYFLDADGILCDGWQTIGDSTYYFQPDDHSMVTGWQDIAQQTYYFDETGKLLTGLQVIGDKTYYLGTDGVRCTGWQNISGIRYYFSPEDGSMLTGWQTIEQQTYYLDETGKLLTGLQVIGDKTYYFGTDGIRCTGWQDIAEKRYYFSPEDGSMLTGWQTIGEKRYYLGTDGAMVSSAFVENIWLNADGTAASELYSINKQRAQNIFNTNGKSVAQIFSYMRSTNRYKYMEATKTLAQIEAKSWLYHVDYAMTHYYTVCYYMAAKMDFLLQEAGYTCRIVHSTHNSGDHYWNQVLINGSWVNYDCTNGYNAYSWNRIIAAGNYRFLGYVTPTYS